MNNYSVPRRNIKQQLTGHHTIHSAIQCILSHPRMECTMVSILLPLQIQYKCILYNIYIANLQYEILAYNLNNTGCIVYIQHFPLNNTYTTIVNHNGFINV